MLNVYKLKRIKDCTIDFLLLFAPWLSGIPFLLLVGFISAENGDIYGALAVAFAFLAALGWYFRFKYFWRV